MGKVTFTGQHFELIANTIKDVSKKFEEPAEVNEKLCGSFADSLAETNPKFDRDRFMDACRVEVD